MTLIDSSAYINSLLLSQPLREPLMRDIFHLMELPVSSYGLDVGCGIGLNTLMLAEMLGPEGRMAGLDSEKAMLSNAQSRLAENELEGRVEFKKGDASNLPFTDSFFDWACSIDCVGALDFDPIILLKELRRVVKPGGIVFISIWSSQMLLPGYPLLEAQLNATSAGIAPFKKGMNPERHIMRAPIWFRQAGFTDIRSQTMVQNVCSPLNDKITAALTDLFKMRWGSIEKEVSTVIWNEYQRLCNPASSDFILRTPDYYSYFTYSVFSGRA